MRFCGGPACSARVQVWLASPEDGIVRDPCTACLGAVAALFDLEPTDPPRSLIEVHRAVAW